MANKLCAVAISVRITGGRGKNRSHPLLPVIDPDSRLEVLNAMTGRLLGDVPRCTDAGRSAVRRRRRGTPHPRFT